MTTPLATWHDIVASKSPIGLDALLADQVVFLSPIVATPQPGKAITLAYLEAVFRVFSRGDFRYVRQLAGPRDAALEFEVELEGVKINGVDMIAWDEQGKIIEFKVMIRPLHAVKFMHQKVAEILREEARVTELVAA
jgi:SnoaL-like domain